MKSFSSIDLIISVIYYTLLLLFLIWWVMKFWQNFSYLPTWQHISYKNKELLKFSSLLHLHFVLFALDLSEILENLGLRLGFSIYCKITEILLLYIFKSFQEKYWKKRFKHLCLNFYLVRKSKHVYLIPVFNIHFM